MRTSRGLAVLYLLLVIGGGAIAAASLTFDIKLMIEPPPADIGLLVLASGLSLLGTVNDRRRMRVVAAVVALSGLGFIIADGVLRLEGLVYVGIATMIAAGAILFMTRSTPKRGGT